MIPSPRAIGIVVVGVLAAGFVGLMAFALLNKAPVTGRSGATRVQKPAPEFTLPLFDGGQLVLAEHLGRPVVINFWASWCAPCRDEAPLLERTWRSYRDRGVQYIGVAIQETEEGGRAYLKEFGITYPNVLDRDGKVTVDYGVIGLPVTFFVNRDGIVERRWVGAVREGTLVAWLDEMVAGLAPSGDAEVEDLDSFRELDRDR